MKTQPIRPADIRFESGAPFSAAYGDVYHPAAGALQQARHVFLAGNGLPERWRGCDHFVVLETGFGLGNNFLASWHAWRHDAQAGGRLHFISIEQHPLTRDDMRCAPRDPVLRSLADELAQAWPPLTSNLHRLSFDGGRVELLLALGDVAAWLPEIVARVDAFYLDGFAPARNPQMWQPRLFKAMGRLAAPGATVATWTAAHAVRDGLAAAGFAVQRSAGQGGKRDITLGRYAPAFRPRQAPARHVSRPAGHAVIVGAGLAGCASALALAQQGWRCTVLDRQAAPAQESSGNAAGLFHGIVNPQDGAHARFNRAAALAAQRCVRQAMATDGVEASVQGLLRLETSGARPDAMQAMLDRLGLPPDYVQAVDAARASAIAGIALQHPAWFYPGGGWVSPAALCAAWLRQAGDQVRLRTGVAVQSVARAGDAWQLLGCDEMLLEEADVVVLANGGDALRLLGAPAWPVQKVRGQISQANAAMLPALPRVPIAGAGYLLPAVDGMAVFGATSQPGDDDPSLRSDDHRANLAQLQRLMGVTLHVPIEALSGRTGWRWVSDDRLPIVGAVPDLVAAQASARLDQPRLVPRVPGLFVVTALGSRGITWSALVAQVLASAASSAPSPVESSLLDAIDPARFLTRERRRSQARE